MFCEAGKHYTLKKVCLCTGEPRATRSAHPARFSPDDKWSAQRIAAKKRVGLLLTQKPGKQF